MLYWYILYYIKILAIGFALTILGTYPAYASIWTTDGSCGDSSQNVNFYTVGHEVYINGANLSPGTYDWLIREPGATGTIVAQGTLTIHAATFDYTIDPPPPSTTGSNGVSGILLENSDEYCFHAYTIQPADSGPYQVKVENFGDNYLVGEPAPDTTLITKSADNLTPHNGDTITYRLDFEFVKTTTGGVTLNFTLFDTFDSSVVTNVTATSSGGDTSCTFAAIVNDTISWNCSVGGGPTTKTGWVEYTAQVTGAVGEEIPNLGCIQVNAGEACDELTLDIIDQPNPVLSLSKEVSTVDGSGYGSSVSVFTGTTVYYRIILHNEGNVPLTGITLSDDHTSNPIPGCPPIPDPLGVGDIYICNYSWSANVNQTNTATADSTETDQVTAQAQVIITSSENPAISVIKSVSTDAGGPFGESVTVVAGTTVYYQIIMTNTGNIPLTGSTLIDNQFDINALCGAPTPDPLPVGESFTCQYSGIASEGTLVNTATADTDQTESVSDSATVTADPASPGINVTKGVSISSAGPFEQQLSVLVGTLVYFQITITNTGNVPLDGIVLTDTNFTPAESVTCMEGAIPNQLAVNDSFTCTYSINVNEQFTNTATAVAEDTSNTSDTDSASVEIIPPGPGPGPMQSIPTLGEWALITLSLLISGIAVVKLSPAKPVAYKDEPTKRG